MSAVDDAVALMERTIHRLLGFEVDFTYRGGNSITISGSDDLADRASRRLADLGFADIDSSVYDAEIGERFVYMTMRLP